jgi:tRNA(Ile)-lysidine synthase
MDGHVRLRPLLLLRHSEIEARLRALDVEWRDDPSNADMRYTRNWVRHHLIPLINERLPQDINAGLARTHGQLRETLMAIDSVVDGLHIDLSCAQGIDCQPLFGQPRAIVRRAWMRWWLRHYPALPFPQGCMEDLLDQLCEGACKTPLAVASGLLLSWEGSGSVLRVETDAQTNAVRIDGTVHWAVDATLVYLPDGAVLRRQTVAVDAPSAYCSADPSCEAWLAVAPDAILVVRGWRAGDRYRPLGSPGRRKLQDMFTDAKIDRLRRASIPLVCDHAGAILWVPGFAPAEQARIGKHTDSALKLTYQMC